MIKNKNDYNQLKIPGEYIDYFEGFDELSLSDEEIDILMKLREYSNKYNKEAIYVSYKGGNTGICSSGYYGKVEIPEVANKKENIRFYHSHTDISALSKADILHLSDKNVDLIANITRYGYVYVIRPDENHRPTYDELFEKIDNIRNEISLEIQYDIMIEAEKNYVLIFETMFQTARYYKWAMEGGKI